MEQKTEAVEIEVMGHKAKIDSVSARQADGTWYKEDFLAVGLTFDEPVKGILGFGVRLPVKQYGKDEFLAKVKAEAEATLPKLLERDRQESMKRKLAQTKQEGLDSLAAEIKSKVGLV